MSAYELLRLLNELQILLMEVNVIISYLGLISVSISNAMYCIYDLFVS